MKHSRKWLFICLFVYNQFINGHKRWFMQSNDTILHNFCLYFSFSFIVFINDEKRLFANNPMPNGMSIHAYSHISSLFCVLLFVAIINCIYRNCHCRCIQYDQLTHNRTKMDFFFISFFLFNFDLIWIHVAPIFTILIGSSLAWTSSFATKIFTMSRFVFMLLFSLFRFY